MIIFQISTNYFNNNKNPNLPFVPRTKFRVCVCAFARVHARAHVYWQSSFRRKSLTRLANVHARRFSSPRGGALHPSQRGVPVNWDEMNREQLAVRVGAWRRRNPRPLLTIGAEPSHRLISDISPILRVAFKCCRLPRRPAVSGFRAPSRPHALIQRCS